MNTLVLILVSTFLISLGALIGVFTLALKEKVLEKILLNLVSISAGALMGGAFFHLLPEALENLSGDLLFSLTLFSFILFFLIEKILHWRHCHKGRCEVHNFGAMNLIGDSFHNFLDGLIIAAAFGASQSLGMATFLAVALHEIPQEIGDFGVLLYSGWEKKKALLANFLVALTVVLGGLVGFYLSEVNTVFIPYLMPIAAGGFLYIAGSDLLPEIRKETSLKKSLLSFSLFLLGVVLMYLIKLI